MSAERPPSRLLSEQFNKDYLEDIFSVNKVKKQKEIVSSAFDIAQEKFRITKHHRIISGDQLRFFQTAASSFGMCLEVVHEGDNVLSGNPLLIISLSHEDERHINLSEFNRRLISIQTHGVDISLSSRSVISGREPGNVRPLTEEEKQARKLQNPSQ